MTPKEAFRFGFMARCIEEGLSHEKTAELIKKADDNIIGMLKEVTYPALGLALATPPAVGGLAAYFANKATDTDASDVEEIKQKELIESYSRMAQQLERQKALRESKAERNKRKRQVFL